jgi:hypothetical protein
MCARGGTSHRAPVDTLRTRMRPDQLNPYPTATYVLTRHKALYVAVNKAACTSIKWLVAELQGEDPERFYRLLSHEVARELTIHRRAAFQNTPKLHDLPPEEIAAISPQDGWFVFAVVRHPAARLFSAWQSKFILREPRFVELFGAEPWMPRRPRRTEDIVEDFRRFVLAIAEDPKQDVMRDRHFMNQHWLVAPQRMPYTRIYKTSELGEFEQEFGAHLRANGHPGEVRLRRSNETPLLPVRAAFDDDVREAIRRLYKRDFELLGFDDDLPPKFHPGDEYEPEVFDGIARLVERHERIGDVVDRGNELWRELADAQRAVKRLERERARRLPRNPRAIAGRARRRLLAPIKRRVQAPPTQP